MEVVALIPARGGSKAIPRKNVAPLGGRPLLAWSVDAARESRAVTRTVVSTDDEEIAAAARGLGAEVLDRPVALAADETPMRDVIEHALAELARPDVLVLLQPTSPLRRARHVDEAVELLRATGADPALRVRARGEDTAVEALAALGFREPELRALVHEFEDVAPRVYEQLAESARAAGDELAATRAAGHSESSEEGKKLLYLSVRALQPRVVVETGPFNGASSTFLLRALEADGRDRRLISFDLPDATYALGDPIP